MHPNTLFLEPTCPNEIKLSKNDTKDTDGVVDNINITILKVI